LEKYTFYEWHGFCNSLYKRNHISNVKRMAVNTKNILVPLGKDSVDLKALYHSFALAKRIRGKVFIMFFQSENPGMQHSPQLEEACLEMVHSAREEGVSVSFQIVHDRFEHELIDFIKAEHIDLIVMGTKDAKMEAITRGIKPRVSVQIIQVEGNQDINFSS
jgi:nucleotide-binding universal stress UspA family protein